MKITVDGRALCGNLTGIGNFTKNLVSPLSKYYEIYISAHKKFSISENFSGKILVGPELYGSLWFHLFFPKLQEDDLLFCPLNIKPYKTKKKSIVIIHDLVPFLYPNWHKLKIRLSYLPFLEDTIQNSCIITISKKTRDEIYKYFQKKDIFVIPNAHNPYIGQIKWERDDLPKEYFLYLGTIEPRKNVNFLINFWEENKYLPPLLIAGDIGWKVKIKKIPKNVKILGYLKEEEKYYLLKNALSLIYPASYEGFGLPVIEAASEGVPVISTLVPAIEEYNIISHIKIDLNFKSLKEALIKVMNGKLPREKSNIPSWDEVALKYKEVIDWYALS